jgi:DNA-binding CsgD family transcriptional regulator
MDDMKLWEHLMAHLGLRPSTESRTFSLTEAGYLTLQSLLEQKHLRPGGVAARLMDPALKDQQIANLIMEAWQMLSPREQDVTALICLNYTNRQMAARLGISPETIKFHVGNVLLKFDLPTRQALHQIFSGWDFSAWEEQELER